MEIEISVLKLPRIPPGYFGAWECVWCGLPVVAICVAIWGISVGNGHEWTMWRSAMVFINCLAIVLNARNAYRAFAMKYAEWTNWRALREAHDDAARSLNELAVEVMKVHASGADQTQMASYIAARIEQLNEASRRARR